MIIVKGQGELVKMKLEIDEVEGNFKKSRNMCSNTPDLLPAVCLGDLRFLCL